MARTVVSVLSGQLKIDKTNVLIQNGSLMKVEIIQQNAPCNTFDLIGIEYQLLVFFISDRLRQVLLYCKPRHFREVLNFTTLCIREMSKPL